jgi:competence protein ComEC
VAFIFGVALNAFFAVGMPVVFLIWFFGGVAMAVGYKLKFFVLVSVLIFVFGIGVWRHVTSEVFISQDYINEITDKIVEFEGIIDDYPDRRIDKTMITIKSEEILGKILITTSRIGDYSYGDRILVRGKLKKPGKIEDFDYGSYLAKSGIFWTSFQPEMSLLSSGEGGFLKQKLFNIRQWWEGKLFQLFPEPQNSFLAGLILGNRSQMPQQMIDNLNRTGTTHIVALSGFNVTIIAVAIFALLQYLGLSRNLNFLLATFAIITFAILTGASPSVVRASIMGVLGLLAWQAGRIYWPRNALVLAAVIMLWINPQVLRFDLSFALSFLATIGLIYLGPILKNSYFKNWPKFFGIKETVSATLAAQAFVLPLLILEFGRLSLVSPLANILVLPAIPLSMLFGFLATLIYSLIVPLGILVGVLAQVTLFYILKVVEFLGALPFASIEIIYFPIIIVVVYIMGLGWFLKRRFYLIKKS